MLESESGGIQSLLIQPRLGCSRDVPVQQGAFQIELNKALGRHLFELQNMGVIVHPAFSRDGKRDWC